jgi:CRP/FNR family transcriptional regulator, cyclic AMP receptor protein
VDVDPQSALRSIPLFAGLDDGALGDLAGRLTSFEAPAGQVLVEVGQPGSGLFVIQEGEVHVELAGRVVTRGAGDFVGEIALLTDRPRTARVRAATNVRCWALARKDFSRLLEDHPTIAVRMLPALADKLADAT